MYPAGTVLELHRHADLVEVEAYWEDTATFWGVSLEDGERVFFQAEHVASEVGGHPLTPEE